MGRGRFPRLPCPRDAPLPHRTGGRWRADGGAAIPSRGALTDRGRSAGAWGNTGGVWGLVRGLAVIVVGGVLVVARGWAGLSSIIEGPAFLIGIMLWVAGWAILARSHGLAFHDHLHVHPHISHQHVHAHRGASQTHDHARPGFRILGAIASPSNLFGAFPAAALEVTPAVLYLVTYLAASTVSMSVFGYWLGHYRREGGDPRWLLQIRTITAGAALVVGTIWVIERWPIT